MPRTKPVCPFTDSACSSCKALFADEPGEKSGMKLRGCQLNNKSRADKPK